MYLSKQENEIFCPFWLSDGCGWQEDIGPADIRRLLQADETARNIPGKISEIQLDKMKHKQTKLFTLVQ